MFTQILLTSSIRNVWRTVRRISVFISGLKELIAQLLFRFERLNKIHDLDFARISVYLLCRVMMFICYIRINFKFGFLDCVVISCFLLYRGSLYPPTQSFLGQNDCVGG